MSGATTWLRRARGSVRLRVTLLAAGAFALVLGVASFVLLRSLEGALVGDVRSANDAILRRQASIVLSGGIPSGAQRVASANGEAFELPLSGGETSGTGRVLLFVQQPTGGNAVDGDASTAATVAEGPSTDVSFFGDVPVSSPEALGIVGPVDDYTISSLRVGGMVLATAASLDEVRDTIATTRTLLWAVGPVLVALVAGLAWLLAGRALRPVHAVTSRVARIGSRSLHERVPVPESSDEIAVLATTMNDMLARLETASASSRRLVSDASHELRTPVTVMRTELEVASRDPSTDWNETSSVLLGELERLQGMVDDLLLLARGDERAFARAPVNVVDLIHDVAARRRRVPVGVEIGTEATMTLGDSAALRRAIDHLVSNAARHAATKVAIATEVNHVDLSVHVDDDGPGIPEGDRERVVQRFVRSDEARARDFGGAGLGLAVTSDVATAHGGHLVIGKSLLGGARATIILPRLMP
jgi:signal transduction histidine kinase